MGLGRKQKISNRLRKTMTDEQLIFPDQRDGLTPYSLICVDCGNYVTFHYDVTIRTVVTVKGDDLVYDYGRIINKKALTKQDRIIMILERHQADGTALWNELNRKRKEVCCSKCSSGNIVLYGDILSECYTNRCIGCFRCGGAFNEENIASYCKQCISLRSSLYKKEDRSLFFMHLDMDLFCDACPIQAVREEYGICGDEIKREASGKLV